MIIDTHIHLGSQPGSLEKLVETAARLKIDKFCLFTAGAGKPSPSARRARRLAGTRGGAMSAGSAKPGSAKPGETERRRTTNEDVLKAHQKYPDTVIPFYYFRLGMDEPRVVERAHRDGFRGLKLINPTRNYNDDSYFPVWERCEDLGMITLFHTGIVARGPQQVHFDVDSSRMKVIYLDRIARKFQKMTMFVAHLGNPDHWEAGMMCRWHANMYFDLSGSTLKYKKAPFFRELLWWGKQKVRYRDELGRGPWEKILFGTDVTPAEMPETMADYKKLFRALKLPKKYQDAVMGGTAAKLLGLTGRK